MKRFEEPKSGHPPTIHHPPPTTKKKSLRTQDQILIQYKRIKWTPSCKASGIGFFLAVIFRRVQIWFAVKVSNLPVFRFAVIFNIFKTTRFFIYRFFQYSINLPVYSVSRYIYRFSICLDVIFCSLRWDCLLASTYPMGGDWMRWVEFQIVLAL